MSYFLVIDTSTSKGSIAVFEDSELIGLQEFNKQRLHSKILTIIIQQLLTNLELSISNFSAIIVGNGPGSYTGLRIGVSVAKGIAFGQDLPLMSFHSLDFLASQVASLAKKLNAEICPMIDARRMEVYCARYDSELNKLTEIEAKILDEETFRTELSEKKMIFVGNGANKIKALYVEHPNAFFLPEIEMSVKNIGNFVLENFNQQKFENLALFEPFYLKSPNATKSKKNPLGI